MHHILKTWHGPFGRVIAGQKTCEVRRCDDRDFKVGDLLNLVEIDTHSHEETGREIQARVLCVTKDAGPLHLVGRPPGGGDNVPVAVLSIVIEGVTGE